MTFVSQFDAAKGRSQRSRIAEARAMAPLPASAALGVYREKATEYIDKAHELIEQYADDPARLLAELDKIKFATTARRAGKLAQTHARRELGRALGKRIPVSKEGDKAVLDAFVAEQQRLFAKLNAEIAARVASGDAEGAKRLARNRARLISSDQVFKVGAEATGYYAIRSGSPRAVWLSRLDEKVRPRHAAMHGKVFYWDNLPPVGRDGSRHPPGGDVHCRCVASPIIERK